MKKSSVKAAGLKSVIHLGENKMIMTNFMDSPIELKISGGTISRVSNPIVFNAAADNDYKITPCRATPSAPGLWKKQKDSPDPLGLRAKTLTKIFKNADKITDNLHIQVAQQILDFKKLFAVYANHLEHMFNNFGGVSTTNNATYAARDWLSNNFIDNAQNLLPEFKNYRKNAAPYLVYFGIKYTPLENIANDTKFNDELYVMLAAVSMLRNSCTHAANQTDYILKPDQIPQEVLAKMKSVLGQRLTAINEKFSATNNKTMQILAACISDFNAQDFYDFTMRQDYKNLGFSIRILREKILKKSPIDVKDNPTEKSRVNKVLDFIIWQKTKENASKYQETLRGAMPEEKDKENPYDSIYQGWADALDLSAEIEQIKTAIGNITNNQSVGNASIAKPVKLLAADDFSPFSIYVYYLCRFLGGHEINELLTGLIHKLENISSFKKIWADLGKDALDFQPDFSLFGIKRVVIGNKVACSDNCKKLSDELRLLNGFVRMRDINKKKKLDKHTDATFGREHWHHLGQVLGSDKTKEEIEAQVKDNHPLRNFISKNALESRRFQYLVKYANIASVRKFAKQNIFEFALSQIPAEQMARYYPNFFGDYASVAKELLAVSWDTFANLDNTKKTNYIGKLRLYFTTLYLIVKNLVNINSRYVMALWRLDFDGADINDYLKKSNQQQKHIKELKANQTKFCPEMFKKYRNTIAHQNAIQFKTQSNGTFDFSGNEKLRSSSAKNSPQSYFSLYHYMVQKCIVPNFQYNDYSKDLLKILNMPFAYNHGRYNALSVEKLFDKNQDDSAESVSPVNN